MSSVIEVDISVINQSMTIKLMLLNSLRHLNSNFNRYLISSKTLISLTEREQRIWCFHRKVWDEITNSSPNLYGCRVEVWEWICNFILHCIRDVTIYPRWDSGQSVLVK